MKKKQRSLTVFFGGELFNLKHLIGNAYIAEAVYERSHGRYLCLLPQDLEPRGTAARTLRDQDLRALVACDLALFCFDGTELDAGTVVEFMFAKFADIPSVVLRSDHRPTGENSGPWNSMAHYYPRTITVSTDGLASYRTVLLKRHRKLDPVLRLAGQHGSAAAQRACDTLATAIVRALDRVRKIEPVMPRHLREEVYNWLPILPGLRGKQKALRKEFEGHLERKVQRDLL